VTAGWRHGLDVALLAGALGLATYFVYARRSRGWVVALTVGCLAYFGFYRQGCVCPVGSIGNVAMAAGPAGGALPWVVAAFFVLPLLFALFAGRVFCAGVCPLGAIQDVVLFKPVRVPGWLEQGLGLFAYAYLGLAVIVAFVGSDLLICRYDPFVGFFRLSGPTGMMVFGGALLVTSMFVGRAYCRFMCPYGVLLRLLSVFSKRRVTITPKDCVECRLCETSCPFGAIRGPVAAARPAERGRRKRQVLVLAGWVPVIVGVFAAVGYGAGGAVARLDFAVRLAERLDAEERGAVEGTTKETDAFRANKGTIEQARGAALAARGRYAWGGLALGAWMGVVVGGKLVALSVRKRRNGYTADPGACLGCARCYASCPEDPRNVQPRAVMARRAAEAEMPEVVA
jgi:NAD-dependent dihydropyrimidine dehydrogenase PreA subunit